MASDKAGSNMALDVSMKTDHTTVYAEEELEGELRAVDCSPEDSPDLELLDKCLDGLLDEIATEYEAARAIPGSIVSPQDFITEYVDSLLEGIVQQEEAAARDAEGEGLVKPRVADVASPATKGIAPLTDMTDIANPLIDDTVVTDALADEQGLREADLLQDELPRVPEEGAPALPRQLGAGLGDSAGPRLDGPDGGDSKRGAVAEAQPESCKSASTLDFATTIGDASDLVEYADSVHSGTAADDVSDGPAAGRGTGNSGLPEQLSGLPELASPTLSTSILAAPPRKEQSSAAVSVVSGSVSSRVELPTLSGGEVPPVGEASAAAGPAEAAGGTSKSFRGFDVSAALEEAEAPDSPPAGPAPTLEQTADLDRLDQLEKRMRLLDIEIAHYSIPPEDLVRTGGGDSGALLTGELDRLGSLIGTEARSGALRAENMGKGIAALPLSDVERSPGGVQRSPGGVQHSPGGVQRSSGGFQHSPGGVLRSAGIEQGLASLREAAGQHVPLERGLASLPMAMKRSGSQAVMELEAGGSVQGSVQPSPMRSPVRSSKRSGRLPGLNASISANGMNVNDISLSNMKGIADFVHAETREQVAREGAGTGQEAPRRGRGGQGSMDVGPSVRVSSQSRYSVEKEESEESKSVDMSEHQLRMRRVRQDKRDRERRREAKLEKQRQKMVEQSAEEDRKHRQWMEERERGRREELERKAEAMRRKALERHVKQLQFLKPKKKKEAGGKKKLPLFMRMEENYKKEESNLVRQRNEVLKQRRKAFEPIDLNQQLQEHQRKHDELRSKAIQQRDEKRRQQQPQQRAYLRPAGDEGDPEWALQRSEDHSSYYDHRPHYHSSYYEAAPRARDPPPHDEDTSAFRSPSPPAVREMVRRKWAVTQSEEELYGPALDGPAAALHPPRAQRRLEERLEEASTDGRESLPSQAELGRAAAAEPAGTQPVRSGLPADADGKPSTSKGPAVGIKGIRSLSVSPGAAEVHEGAGLRTPPRGGAAEEGPEARPEPEDIPKLGRLAHGDSTPERSAGEGGGRGRGREREREREVELVAEGEREPRVAPSSAVRSSMAYSHESSQVDSASQYNLLVREREQEFPRDLHGDERSDHARRLAGRKKKKTSAMAKVLEQEEARKQEAAKAHKEKMEKKEKQKQYGKMVKQLFVPRADQEKKLQLKLAIEDEREKKAQLQERLNLPAIKAPKYALQELFADRRVKVKAPEKLHLPNIRPAAQSTDGPGERGRERESGMSAMDRPIIPQPGTMQEKWATEREDNTKRRRPKKEKADEGRTPFLPALPQSKSQSYSVEKPLEMPPGRESQSASEQGSLRGVQGPFAAHAPDGTPGAALHTNNARPKRNKSVQRQQIAEVGQQQMAADNPLDLPPIERSPKRPVRGGEGINTRLRKAESAALQRAKGSGSGVDPGAKDPAALLQQASHLEQKAHRVEMDLGARSNYDEDIDDLLPLSNLYVDAIKAKLAVLAKG